MCRPKPGTIIDFHVARQPKSSTITTQVGGSFTGSLTFSAAGAPEGVTVSFDPPSVAGSGSSIVTVSVAQRTSTGSYPITISGNGDGLNTTTTLTVIATAEVLLTWDPSTSGDVVGYSISRSETLGGGYVRLNSDLTSGTRTPTTPSRAATRTTT